MDRDRPTGLAMGLPETLVRLASPQRDQLVPADSVIPVIVRADGLLQAVEFIMRHESGRDTLMRDRKDFSDPAESVEVEFEVRIPKVTTGTHLQFIGVAENVLGERRETSPVPVIVIECDIFRSACAGL